MKKAWNCPLTDQHLEEFPIVTHIITLYIIPSFFAYYPNKVYQSNSLCIIISIDETSYKVSKYCKIIFYPGECNIVCSMIKNILEPIRF